MIGIADILAWLNMLVVAQVTWKLRSSMNKINAMEIVSEKPSSSSVEDDEPEAQLLLLEGLIENPVHIYDNPPNHFSNQYIQNVRVNRNIKTGRIHVLH